MFCLTKAYTDGSLISDLKKKKKAGCGDAHSEQNIHQRHAVSQRNTLSQASELYKTAE